MLQPRSASTVFESLSISCGPGPEPFAIALAWLKLLETFRGWGWMFAAV